MTLYAAWVTIGMPELVGGPAGGAEEIEAARLHLARRQEAAHAAAGGAVHALDEVERRLEFALAGRLVDDALEPTPLAAHPAAGVVARAEIGADAEALDLRQQRLLHAPLAAELHERGDAVAQQLGHRERGVQTRAALGAVLVGAQVARIAADSRAFARHADVEEGLAVVVRPSGVRDQPVRRAVAGVHVRVDEAGRDELAARVDHEVGGAVEARADVDDALVFPHHDAVADQRVRAAAEADDPAAADQSAHGAWLARTMRERTTRAAER